MINADSISTFFLGTTAHLKSYKEFLELNAAELAPEFNSFNFIRPNENTLSDIIAVMLDPNGEHAQKTTFLRLFLEKLNLDNFKNLELETAKVEREHSTETNRRIDILIRLETKDKNPLWIGIENKPWAQGQDKQVYDYIKHIENRIGRHGGTFKFIYIPANEGENPEEWSLPKNIKDQYKNQYMSLSYEEVKKWVAKCQLNCRAERLRSFLLDFERYIEKEFYGGTEMEKKIIEKQVLSSFDNFEVALLVSNSIIDIKKDLLEKLKKDLEEERQKRKLDLNLEWKLSYDEKWTHFSFSNKCWKKYCIAFEPDKKSMNEFGYGIMRNIEGKLDNKDIIETIIRYFGEGEGDDGGANSEWWLWAKYAQDDGDKPLYRSWENDPKPWMEIQNGEMAKKIIDVTLKLMERLETFHTETGIEI